VIIGSGITGASIAWKLLQAEPDASILILEARTASSGATGRNGGHCRAGRYLNFKTDLETFGKEEALKLETLEEQNVKNVGEFIKKHGIEYDLRDVGPLISSSIRTNGMKPSLLSRFGKMHLRRESKRVC
jgi:glycine/D-amino acid oxidase-like deaminating enzyme